jgi:hypothetical protein
MRATVVVRTLSGSAYLFSLRDTGVEWHRLPSGEPDLVGPAGGWESELPLILPGRPLLIGTLRTTPVLSVAILPD